MKLYETTAAVKEVERLLEDGVVERDAAVATIESLLPVAKEKGLNLAAIVQNNEAEIKAMKEAEARMKKRRMVQEANVRWLKDYLRENMERLGWDKIESPQFVVRLRKNPPKVDVGGSVEIESLDAAYLVSKTTVSLNKKAIKEAIENGVELEGIDLIQTNRIEFS